MHKFTVTRPPWWHPGPFWRFWQRDSRSCCERLRDDALIFGLRLSSGLHRFEVTAGTVIAVNVASPRAVTETPKEWHEVVERLFGLDQDPTNFESLVRALGKERLLEGRAGLTVPRTATVWDGLVWAILGQQVSLAVAFAMRRRLTERFGERLDADLQVLPSPEALAAQAPSDLVAAGLSRAKADYLHRIAVRVAQGTLDLEGLRELPAPQVEALLLALHGLGPWSVNYLMMRSIGFDDCVPVGDAALGRSLQEFFGLSARPDRRQTLELMSPFAPHRSLATFHLWARLKPLGGVSAG